LGLSVDQIEDRLGGANTLASFGRLALARSEPPRTFSFFLDALELHRSIEGRLGEAGAHGYLARAAEELRAFEALLQDAVKAQERALAERGEDPYSPLA
jgi:hypothetical protein